MKLTVSQIHILQPAGSAGNSIKIDAPFSEHWPLVKVNYTYDFTSSFPRGWIYQDPNQNDLWWGVTKKEGVDGYEVGVVNQGASPRRILVEVYQIMDLAG